jgi:chromosome segregation ATPase
MSIQGFDPTTKRKLQIMNHTQLIIAFLAVSAFALGCNKEQTTSQQLDEVKAETKSAAQDMKGYTFAQKGEFVAKMQGQLEALKKDLEQLSAKIESSSDAVKAEAKPKLQALRDQTTQLNEQLDNARNASESTWDSVKETSQKAFDSLKVGFQQSRQWVSDKIAP